MVELRMAVKVFLAIITEPGKFDEIYDIVHAYDEVSFLCKVDSGSYDIMAMVTVKTLDDYRKLIERVASLHHLEHFESFITLDV
jgi:DNA-binding Lrp family transcriptional regulator